MEGPGQGTAKMTRNPKSVDLFEVGLTVSAEDIEFELRGYTAVPWASFLLNPRRLRGSDFLMRWSQGVWSEERLIEAVGATRRFIAIPYGPSSTAPEDDVREFELYFERLELAGLGDIKRPDLLIFQCSIMDRVNGLIQELGGTQELPFTPEDHPSMRELVSMAVIAVECENSLWKAKRMPQYGEVLRPMRRLGGQPGLPKGAVLPTVILKEEDRDPLAEWQSRQGVSIHIWHVFFDMAFGISLDATEDLIIRGRIEPTDQVFQAPGGATSTKPIYKIYYHYAYPVAMADQEPSLVAEYIEDKNGHVLPYVRFEGGSLRLTQKALEMLDKASKMQ